jgi:probable selenium-dependent hydroxylase accessory protein YqeC
MDLSLTALSAFSIARGDRVALVGGGGKSALRDRLAAEARAAGWRVLLTTTTKTGPPEGVEPIVEEDPLLRAERARAAMDRDGVAFVVARRESESRLIGVEPVWLELMQADLVVVEADGSRKKPLKAPAPTEPVIPETSTLVVAVVGAEVIGAPLTEARVHRLPLFTSATGLQAGDLLTPEALAKFVVSPRGYRKGVPDRARFVPFVNKVSLARPGAVEALVAALGDVAALWGEARDGAFNRR